MEHLTENVELHAIRSYPYHKKIAIYADAYDARGNRPVSIHSPVYEEREVFAETKPLVTISVDAAQKLFQSLWDIGHRPESQDGNVGMLSATQEHLNSMKKLVSEAYGVIL